MLKVDNLKIAYGMIQAIKGISFEVHQGEIVTLIGANGAGKTSTLKTLSGLVKAQAGSVSFEGEDLLKATPQEIVKMGISQVPEGRHVFKDLTVKENLEMGAFLRKDKNQMEEDLTSIYKRFPILKERLNQAAATLSGGEQQMLAMGRALMSRPRLLLLDEPSMGLAPIFIKEIFQIIQEIQSQGTTVLLIEQNAKMALQVADRAYVLENGNIVLSGTGNDLLASDQVQKAYLGG